MRTTLACVLIAGAMAAAPALAAQDAGAPAPPPRHEGANLNPRFERMESRGLDTVAPRPDAGGQVMSQPAPARATGAPPVFEQRRGGRGGGNPGGGRGPGGGPGMGAPGGGPRGGARGGTQGVPPRVYEPRGRSTVVVPRRVYPYAYGAFGLGYFYYDPYWYPWGPWGWGYPRAYGYGYDDRRDDLGRVRLDVRGPRDAEVLVDGYYAGILDDFDGSFQALDLESGEYRIEVQADGYEPLVFDTRVSEGRKITLHGAMRRAE